MAFQCKSSYSFVSYRRGPRGVNRGQYLHAGPGECGASSGVAAAAEERKGRSDDLGIAGRIIMMREDGGK